MQAAANPLLQPDDAVDINSDAVEKLWLLKLKQSNVQLHQSPTPC